MFIPWQRDDQDDYSIQGHDHDNQGSWGHNNTTTVAGGNRWQGPNEVPNGSGGGDSSNLMSHSMPVGGGDSYEPMRHPMAVGGMVEMAGAGHHHCCHLNPFPAWLDFISFQLIYFVPASSVVNSWNNNDFLNYAINFLSDFGLWIFGGISLWFHEDSMRIWANVHTKSDSFLI